MNSLCQLSPECFLADIPDRSFLSSADQPDLELLAALESDGKYGSSAGPSAAVAWLASGKKGQSKARQPPQHNFFPHCSYYQTNFRPSTKSSASEIISFWNYQRMHAQLNRICTELSEGQQVMGCPL